MCGEDSLLTVDLGFLKMPINPLQCAFTLMCLFNLENPYVIYYGVCRHTMCTFLISSLFMCVLMSFVDQLDGSCESVCGPIHHSVDIGSVEGSIHLVTISAVLV